MDVLTAAEFSPELSAFTVSRGPPRTVTVPNAARLAALREVTVTGLLLRKQFIALDLASGDRTGRIASNNGAYVAQSGDGDLHFCLGTEQLQPHIACELQSARPWLSTFNGAIDETIAVAGFLRCLFEHPGFNPQDDAHIFEIHPVRAVDLGGEVLGFDIDIPDQDAIHTWLKPFNLNDQDGRIQVTFDQGTDTLTFTGMDGKDENYVRVWGVVDQVELDESAPDAAHFTFTSADIGHPVDAYCLKGTTAYRQLKEMNSPNADLVVLRNIDLSAALQGRYAIDLLVIDLQETAMAPPR
jgi:hypothetical protein